MLSKESARPPSFALQTTQTGWHKRKEGTLSFQKHTMFKQNQKFEGNWPANTTQKGSLLTFILLRSLTSSRMVLCHCEHSEGGELSDLSSPNTHYLAEKGRKLQLSPLEHCPLVFYCQQSPRHSLFTLFCPLILDHGVCLIISVSGFKILNS